MKQLRPTPEPPPVPWSVQLVLGSILLLGLAWWLVPVIILLAVMFFELNCDLWSKLIDLVTRYFWS